MAEYVYAVRLYAHVRVDAADQECAHAKLSRWLDYGQLDTSEDGPTPISGVSFAPLEDELALVEVEGQEIEKPVILSSAA